MIVNGFEEIFPQELGHDPQHWQLQMDHNRQVHILPRNNAAPGGGSLHGDPGHLQQQPLATPEHHHDQAVNMAAGSVKVRSNNNNKIVLSTQTFISSVFLCRHLGTT